jgi:hypothetical protein
MATLQAESARGAVDHLKITGGMGIDQQESADAISKHCGVDRGQSIDQVLLPQT